MKFYGLLDRTSWLGVKHQLTGLLEVEQAEKSNNKNH